MQAQLYQFESSLQQPLKASYIFSGEEPLLLMEALDALRKAAKQQGFDEKIDFEVNNEFDWQRFIEETQAMSLFSEKKMIVLNIANGKPGKEGSKALANYCSMPSADIVLVLACGKVDFRGGKPPAWYKKVDEIGMSVRLWPVTRDKLSGWIKQRAKKLALNLSEQAIAILVDRTDGNLLATAQELEKLTLLSHNGVIDEKLTIQSISQNSHYSIYECIDAALQGNAELTTKMLMALKVEHFPAAIVIWALNNECQKLEQLAWFKRTSGLNNGVFMKHQIWKNRQGLVAKALNQHNYAFWAACVSYCASLDKNLKGRQLGAPLYEAILDLLLQIAGKPLYQPVNRLLQRTTDEQLVIN